MPRKSKEATAEVETSEETAPVEQAGSRISRVLAGEGVSKMLKRWGPNALMTGSDESLATTPRIPSGIMTLDWALGGGWPAGRINTIYGHKSTAKTTAMMKMIAAAQSICATCFAAPGDCKCKEYRDTVSAFIDVEGTWDADWVRKLGADPDRIIHARPEYAEQSLDILETFIRGGEVDVLVLDSIAFLTPLKEIEESVEKETMGAQARLLGKSIRKIVAALAHAKNEYGRYPTLFFTNQIRMKIGVMFGNPEIQSGGLATGFASSTEVRMGSAKYTMDEETGKAAYADFQFKVEKNKSGPPKMENSFRLVLADTETKKLGDLYEEDGMVNLGQKFGLVEGGGSSWKCMGEAFGGKKYIEQKLLTDSAFKKRFREVLMKILLAV